MVQVVDILLFVLQIAGQEDLKRSKHSEKSDNDVAWSKGVEEVEQITNNYWTPEGRYPCQT